MLAHYETRNDAAHDGLDTRIDAVGDKVDVVRRDIAYLRGRQDERDMQRTADQ